jgi:2-polyprenyl-3-methyl-5-hydroxy-6-metoxy-1,4-benzoquinol methylase
MSAQPWPGGLESVAVCPVCADPRRREEIADARDDAFGAAPGSWHFQRCQGCDSLYLDPRPDRASLHLAYTNYYTHGISPTAKGRLGRLRLALSNGYRNKVFATNRTPSLAVGAWVMPLFSARAAHIRREDRGLGRASTPGRRVLDVGCGNGEFLTWARELGWSCYGLEIDPAAAQLARDSGVEIIGSDIDQLDESYLAAFDAVTAAHVIEHVYDPMALLRQCLRVLRPGGYFWVETPNSKSFGYAQYGAHWRGLEAPRHLALFTPASLRWAFEQVGFERIEILPPANVIEPLFLHSAAMRLGRIAEKDARPLPEVLRNQTVEAARRAREQLGHHPDKSEFITVSAYKPC